MRARAHTHTCEYLYRGYGQKGSLNLDDIPQSQWTSWLLLEVTWSKLQFSVQHILQQVSVVLS